MKTFKKILLLVLLTFYNFNIEQAYAETEQTARGVTVLYPETKIADIHDILKKLDINTLRIKLNIRRNFFRLPDHKRDLRKLQTATILWVENILNIANKENLSIIISESDFPFNKERKYRNEYFNRKSDSLREFTDFLDIMFVEFESYCNRQEIIFDFVSEPVNIKYENWLNLVSKIDEHIIQKSNCLQLISPPNPLYKESLLAFEEAATNQQQLLGLHFYMPRKYTHQGIKGISLGKQFPGWYNFKRWNYNTLRRSLIHISEYSKQRDVRVIVGEYSVVHSADGAEAHLIAISKIFDELELGHLYFAASGWSGWNPHYSAYNMHEYTKSSRRLDYSTDRWKTLVNIYGKQNE